MKMFTRNGLLTALLLILNIAHVSGAMPSSPKKCVSNYPSFTSSSMGLPTHLKIRGGETHSVDNLDDLDAILMKAGAERQLVVIDFTATWCGPCQTIAPLFKKFSEEFSNVVFVKVDVDESPETAAKYSVSAMPTFIFLSGGQVIDRLMGANPSRLKELIEEHM